MRYTELDVLGVHFAIGGLTGIHTHTHTHTHIHGGDKVPKAHDPDSQGSEEVDHLQDSQKLSKCLAWSFSATVSLNLVVS